MATKSDGSPRKTQRPSVHRTPEICAEIIERIQDGEPLEQICRDEGMPSSVAFGNWCNADEALALAYARARQAGYDRIAADVLKIADDGSNDYVETEHGQRLNAEHVQRSKLRVDARLKLLACWDPKRYGQRVDMTSAGESLAPKPVDLVVSAREIAFALALGLREAAAKKVICDE